MSVEFAQQSELARINRRAGQTSTSMQTQSDEEEVEDKEVEEADERTPRASPATGAWLEEVERERLERELEERNAEIRKLKEELQKTERGSDQVSVDYRTVHTLTCCSTLDHRFINPISQTSQLLCH